MPGTADLSPRPLLACQLKWRPVSLNDDYSPYLDAGLRRERPGIKFCRAFS
jgi:hypothetical protein